MNFSAMTVDSSRFYIIFYARIVILTRKNTAMPMICQAKIGLATIPFDFMAANWEVCYKCISSYFAGASFRRDHRGNMPLLRYFIDRKSA
jgi:hypothetical protein